MISEHEHESTREVVLITYQENLGFSYYGNFSHRADRLHEKVRTYDFHSQMIFFEKVRKDQGKLEN